MIVHTSFVEHAKIGVNEIAQPLLSHKLIRVKWDRSDEFLILAANLTEDFVGLGSFMITMIDGLKLESLEPSDYLDQN